MSDIVKFVPEAALPRGGVRAWKPEAARRWRDARVPLVFAPTVVCWLLVPLVFYGFSVVGTQDSEAAASPGTDWVGFHSAILFLALPAWYRFLPAATTLSAPVIALDMAARLYGPDAPAGENRAGCWLVIGLCAWAFTGALLRLRSRRRQRALFLEATGGVRGPIPEHLPAGHRHRGRWLLVSGGLLTLAGAVFLAWALVADLGASTDAPYDAVGQQVAALFLLLPGPPLLGHGLAARRAARRLHDGPQPVLRVGVRRKILKNSWLVADARTTTAPPLIAFRDRYEDSTRPWDRGSRTLLGGPEDRLRVEHHDIDGKREPYEAILYGLPCEGAEVILEHAVYYDGRTITSQVTAAPLLPARRHGLRPWTPAGSSHRLRRRAEEDRRRTERAARGDSSSGGSGCGSSGSCGSDSSCGSSCGGGCGGGD
ncbi:hypothetical protein [Streptomyces sp. NPDC006463]|uniref:hypothetical protein n=1 Tax=Streptomyces sp. NPDC006463 TaxID=3364746 RepID=UPI0036844428